MNWAANRATKGLGASFKGLGLYLLNPKRGEGTVAERVGFTLCQNLATNDPDTAWRLMAETAIRRDQIKMAAGGSKAGRRPAEGEFKPVFHYALSWHPDQRPDEAEMQAAALASIKALKMEGHEALIVQHIDQDHAHVHIVLNRVDPETGKLNTLSNGFRKLDRWAAEYERETGEIVSLNREEKHRAIDEGRRPAPANDRWLPYEEWTQTRNAARAQAGEARTTLWESQSEVRDELLDAAKARARELSQALREAQRPGWQQLGRNQSQRDRDLEAALESRAGIVGFINQHRELLHKAWPDEAERQAQWATLLTRGGLTAALAQAQEMETAEFKRDITHDRHAMQREFWSDYREKVDALRTAQADERKEFRQQQGDGKVPPVQTGVAIETPDATLPKAREVEQVRPQHRPTQSAVLTPELKRAGDFLQSEAASRPKQTEADKQAADRARALERIASARAERLAREAQARERAALNKRPPDRGDRER